MRLGSDWRRLHPLSPLLRAGRFVLVATAILADDLAARFDVRPVWAGLFLMGALVIGAVAGWWAWKTTGYRVTAEEVELRTGMLFRRDRRVPLARLESIDLARPLFARLFGLTQVRLEAVSDQESEVRLSYLDHDAAVALRDELRTRIEHSPAPASGEESAGPEPLRPIIRVPTGELVVAHVVARVAWAWSALLVVAVVILAAVGPGAAAAFLFVIVLPVGIVPAVVGLAEVDRLHGFTLSEGGRGLHITRGLLNEMQQVVPLDRVQAVAVVEPFLWRFFGRAKLVVDVAGYRGGSNQDREQSSVLLPVAPATVVAEVLSRVRPDLHLDELSYVRAPVGARWRAPVRWRSYSIAFDGGHAVMRRGLLRRRTDIVPHRKVQSLRVTQGPWQRSLGLATLHLDTAGTRIRAQARHRRREEAEGLAWASRRAANVSP
jgi:putative membrane protein